jgi:hypothetical protein
MSVMRAHLSNLRIAGVALAAAMVLPASAHAYVLDVGPLAHAMRRNPVQVVGRPSHSLSAPAVRSLRARIRSKDRGRIWIAVVPSSTEGSASRLSNTLSGYLNADGGGTVVVVAGGSVWASTSWEDGPGATSRLQDAFRNSDEPLASQLRKVVDSFASGDAAADHPQLNSSPDTGSQSLTQTLTQTQTQPNGSTTAGGARSSSSSSSPVGLIIGLVALAIGLGLALLRGGPRIRRTMRASHRRKEEQADLHEQVQADFMKLGDAIQSLDIDSSMPNASTHGKDEYAKALDCYQQAERRLKESRDEYQFERATAAVKEGLEHVGAAERLLNQTQGHPAGG